MYYIASIITISGVIVKKCIKCFEEKPVKEFVKDKNTCKICRREPSRLASIRYRKRHPEKIEAIHRERYLKEKATGTIRHRDKKAMILAVRKWQLKNPHKMEAAKQVQKAVREGRLRKAELCQLCFKDGKLHGHHHDYDKPLKVLWVCVHCHKIVDRVRRFQESS